MTAITRDISKYESDRKEFDSLDSLLRSDESASGLYSIRHRADVYTDVLFWNQQSDVTIVCFNGAGAPAGGKRPGFNGTSMFNSWKLVNKANFVFIHDATLYLHENLRLAWYIGEANFDYTNTVEGIIRHFVNATDPDHLIFFGISGGGHAALNYSTKFPGSVAVAGNPQTNIDKYESPFRDNYYKTCWVESNSPASEGDNPKNFDLTARYADGTDNFAYCLVNINDKHHVEQHLIPLIEAASRHLNVRTLIRYWGSGHAAPSPQFLLEFFDELVSRLREGSIFPAVKESRLLENKNDVYAIAKYQSSPAQQELFTGLIQGVDQAAFALNAGVTETLEVNADVEFTGHSPGKGKIELILDSNSNGQYIYGLRATSSGYESTFVFRSGGASVLRTYVPSHLVVRGIRIIFPPGENVALRRVLLTSYNNNRVPQADQWRPEILWNNSSDAKNPKGPAEVASPDDSPRIEIKDIPSLSSTVFPVDTPTRLNVVTSSCTIPLLVVRRKFADRTVVFSNGAVDLNRSNRAPVFQRSTWWESVVGHQIFVCDPGTVGPEALGLSWGHLSQTCWCIPDISVVVHQLAEVLGTAQASQRIYFGSSGGGFMSIGLCHYDPGSRAVVNNAQLDWTLWMTGAVNALRSARFDNLMPADIRMKWPTTTSVLKLIQSGNTSPQIDYLVNLASKHDSSVELPLMERFIKDNPQSASNIRVFKYRHQASGHNPLFKDIAIKCINGDVANVKLPGVS